MSNSKESITRLIQLPEMGAFQYIPGINPGLMGPNSEVYVPYINSPDPDLSVVFQPNGTIDVYNVSGRRLPAGKVISVTAVQQRFASVRYPALVVSDPSVAAPQYQAPYNLPPMNATALDAVTFSNVATKVPFDAVSSLALTTQGYIDDPGTQGGSFVVRKTGVYLFQGHVCVKITAGGAGFAYMQLYINDNAQGGQILSSDVNFGAGNVNKIFPINFSTVVSQASLDVGGGQRKFDWRVYTSAGAITGQFGTSGIANVNNSSSALNVSRPANDYFSAP